MKRTALALMALCLVMPSFSACTSIPRWWDPLSASPVSESPSSGSQTQILIRSEPSLSPEPVPPPSPPLPFPPVPAQSLDADIPPETAAVSDTPPDAAELSDAPPDTAEATDAPETAELPDAPSDMAVLPDAPALSVPLVPVKKTRRERPGILVFTEGLTGSYLTRIIRQEKRSNFVFEDYLAGLFFNVKTRPLKPVNIMARLSAYYPLLFYFNDVLQPPASPIHYGADLFLGPVFEPHIKNLIRFNLSPGLHLFFENTERWNYLHLGAAALAGIELPVTRRWTLYLEGLASLDYGNLGNNRSMEPYDVVYQYQIGAGLRYSKRSPNTRPWIGPRRKKGPS